MAVSVASRSQDSERVGKFRSPSYPVAQPLFIWKRCGRNRLRDFVGRVTSCPTRMTVHAVAESP